jgi:hypothetical protein
MDTTLSDKIGRKIRKKLPFCTLLFLTKSFDPMDLPMVRCQWGSKVFIGGIKLLELIGGKLLYIQVPNLIHLSSAK